MTFGHDLEARTKLGIAGELCARTRPRNHVPRLWRDAELARLGLLLRIRQLPQRLACYYVLAAQEITKVDSLHRPCAESKVQL